MSDRKKIEEKYTKNMRSLVALLDGEKNLREPKIPKDEVGTFVEKMLKKKKETLYEEAMNEGSALIDSHIQFGRFVKQEQQKFDNAVVEKKKEFNEKTDRFLKKFSDLATYEKEFYAAVKGTAVEADKNEENDGEEEDK